MIPIVKPVIRISLASASQGKEKSFHFSCRIKKMAFEEPSAIMYLLPQSRLGKEAGWRRTLAPRSHPRKALLSNEETEELLHGKVEAETITTKIFEECLVPKKPLQLEWKWPLKHFCWSKHTV